MTILERGAATFIKTIRTSQEMGVLETAKIILRRPIVWYWGHIDREFDRLWGTNTSGRIELGWLDIESESKNEGTWYEPTGFKLLHAAMDQIDTTRYPVFVDYGSGKGRVLLVASEYNFSRILGVEFSRELHETAQRNIEIYNNPQQRCTDIESVCMDALEFEPPSEPCVLFFFGPFKNQVMRKVLEKIKISSSKNQTDMAIVFIGHNPENIAYLEALGWHKLDLGEDWNARRSRRYRLLIYSRNSC